MSQDIFIKLSKILKVLSKIAAFLLIPYGFIVGILGVAAEGPLNSTGWRFIGLVLLSQGILYFIPNQKISEKSKYIYLFLAATFSPSIALVIVSLFNILTNGLPSFIRYDLLVVIILIPLSLFAPFSLLCYLRQKAIPGEADGTRDGDK